MTGNNSLTSGYYRHHGQSTNTEIDQPRSPSKMSRCLSQETTTKIPPQQVSHFTTVNPVSSMDTCLITDTTIDGHTSFNTTLQVIPDQGSKLLHINVDQEHHAVPSPYPTFTKPFQNTSPKQEP